MGNKYKIFLQVILGLSIFLQVIVLYERLPHWAFSGLDRWIILMAVITLILTIPAGLSLLIKNKKSFYYLLFYFSYFIISPIGNFLYYTKFDIPRLDFFNSFGMPYIIPVSIFGPFDYEMFMLFGFVVLFSFIVSLVSLIKLLKNKDKFLSL